MSNNELLSRLSEKIGFLLSFSTKLGVVFQVVISGFLWDIPFRFPSSAAIRSFHAIALFSTLSAGTYDANVAHVLCRFRGLSLWLLGSEIVIHVWCLSSMSAVCGSFALGCGTLTRGRGVSAGGGVVFAFSGIGIFAC